MNNIINTALLKEHLKRFWAIPTLSALVLLLGVYAPMFGNTSSHNSALQLINIVSMGNVLMMSAIMLTPVVAVLCTFEFFFKKRAVTAFYSMPMNKDQLFATNAIAGTILSLIPIFVFCVILLLPLNFGYSDINFDLSYIRYGYEHLLKYGDNSFPLIAGLFLRLSLVTLFYFSLAWLAFSLSGHRIIGLIILVVMPFIPLAFIGLLEFIANEYAGRGHFSIISGRTFEWTAVCLYPVAWGGRIRATRIIDPSEAIMIPAIVCTTLTVAMSTGAYIISSIRKPERTGDSVMFIPVKNVLIFLFAFSFMFFGGLLFEGIWDNIAMMHIGLIVGFTIGYAVAQMIAEKSFQIFGKLKYFPYFFGTITVLYLLMLFVTKVILS
ncbi:MAG: hypothetical protein LBI27_07025 [Clostridiales bacterium]|jgi:hypothetical protein|nr:hypothetical protein [Clostridiales bacterium]